MRLKLAAAAAVDEMSQVETDEQSLLFGFSSSTNKGNMHFITIFMVIINKSEQLTINILIMKYQATKFLHLLFKYFFHLFLK